jgi:hypothetical protein
MNLSTNIEDAEYDKLKKWADARGMNRSAAFRGAISLMLEIIDDESPDVDKIIEIMMGMNPKFESATHIRKEVDDELSLRSRKCAKALIDLSKLDIGYVGSSILNPSVKGPTLTFMRNADVYRQAVVGVLEMDSGNLPVVVYPKSGTQVVPDLKGDIHCKLRKEG